jgi:hypothetical protein
MSADLRAWNPTSGVFWATTAFVRDRVNRDCKFEDLLPGQYAVWITWPAFENRASRATALTLQPRRRKRIQHPTESLGSVNQQLPPDGPSCRHAMAVHERSQFTSASPGSRLAD